MSKKKDGMWKGKWEAGKLALSWTYRSSPGLFILVIIISIIAGLMAIVPPYILKLIIDSITEGQSAEAGLYLLMLILVYAVTGSIHNVVYNIMNLVRYMQDPRIRRYAMLKIAKKTSTLDVVHFEDPEYHNTIMKANENLTRVLSVFWEITYLIAQLVATIVIIGGLMTFSLSMVGLVVLSVVPAIYVSLRAVRRSWATYEVTSPMKRYAKYFTALMTERKESFRESKVFNLGGYFNRKVDRLYSRIIDKWDRVHKKEIKWTFVSVIFESALVAAAAWLVVRSAADGNISVGDLTFYWALLFQFSSYMRETVRMLGHLDKEMIFLMPLMKTMKYEPEIRDPDSPRKFPKKISEGIEFRNVSFKYPRSDKYALRNLNLRIGPGENIAIVGENGCGKTTLVKLLCRFYDPTEGEILIDGVNIKEYSLKDLYRNIGVIFQDFEKYEAMVEENIGFGKKGKGVHRSSVKSGAWEFIKSMEKDYKTHLGRTIKKEGTELSGGQWQKVALARAFFKDSQILILDEPTAAVDAKAEYDLFKKFNQLTKNKTSILISHRFSTVRMTDKIVVVDKGRVKESGSHKELLKKKGLYAELFNLQAKGYK